jgi:transcriptional regulator with XRE-family HTH domain
MVGASQKARTRKGGAPRKNPLAPIGRRIDELAEKIGVGPSELAAQCGITRQALGLIRSGKTTNPSAETTLAIAKALHVSVEALCGGSIPAHQGAGRPAFIPLSEFGVRVQRRLDALRISRQDLAAKTDINHVTIWRWMTGRSKVPFDAACRLAAALHCRVSDLQSPQ